MGRGTAFDDRLVRDLPDLLRPGDALVFNDTRVIRAALQGERLRGENRAQISFNLHKRIDESRWRAFARPAKRLAAGDRIRFGHDGRVCLLGTLDATVTEIGEAGEVELSFSLHGAYLDEAIAALGDPPLPPYIAGKRDVAARGCRALPDRLRPPRRRRRRADGRPAFHARAAGGAGRARRLPPFRHAARRRRHLPARQGRRYGAASHARRVGRDFRRDRRGPQRGARRRRAHRRRRHDLAAAAGDGRATRRWHASAPFAGETDLFITPGYRFKAVDLLLTNFHLPRSTLFMLVAAFSGLDTMRAAYAHAHRAGYRFYSYGDACLLYPAPAAP